MTTKEDLHKYRESTLGEEPHVRVFFFHAHIYYEPDGPQKSQMLALHKKLLEDFKDDPDVEVHTLQARFFEKGCPYIRMHFNVSTENLRSNALQSAELVRAGRSRRSPPHSQPGSALHKTPLHPHALLHDISCGTNLQHAGA